MKKTEKPTVEAPIVEEAQPATSTVINPATAKIAGLSPDAKVTLFATYHDRYSKNIPEDLKGSPQFLSGMNVMTDILGIAIFAEEAVNSDTVIHQIVEKSPKAYAALQLAAKMYDIELPALALLPAPTKEQMKAAGLEGESPENKVVVTVSKKDIDKKAQQKIAEEQKVVRSKPAETPTDVKDEAGLKAALINIFVKGDRPVARAKKAINFYRAYLKLQVKDNEEELKKIEEMTDVDLLSDIKSLIGDCPYKDSGIAKYLRDLVAKSSTPIDAYCTLYRSGRNRKTGDMEATPGLIAAICRTYVIWSAEALINEANATIAQEERQLKKLDEKKNAEAIATINENIKNKKADIEYANDIIAIVTNPSAEIVDNIVEIYNDENHEEHNIVVNIVDSILKTMYPNQDMSKYEAECVENNFKQYAGIIINLFRDPASQLAMYGEGNLVELVEIQPEEGKK